MSISEKSPADITSTFLRNIFKLWGYNCIEGVTSACISNMVHSPLPLIPFAIGFTVNTGMFIIYAHQFFTRSPDSTL